MQPALKEIRNILAAELAECPIKYEINQYNTKTSRDDAHIKPNCGETLHILVRQPKDMVTIAHALLYATQAHHGDPRTSTCLRTDGDGNPNASACELQIWLDAIDKVVMVRVCADRCLCIAGRGGTKDIRATQV